MEEIIKETVVTKGDVITSNPAKAKATDTQTTEYVIYFMLGALEILLAFRMFFKLAGASTSSSFVRFVYGLSGAFIMPFEGIFRRGFTQGLETTAVLEPAVVVGLAVYAVLAWGLVKLLGIWSGEVQTD